VAQAWRSPASGELVLRSLQAPPSQRQRRRRQQDHDADTEDDLTPAQTPEVGGVIPESLRLPTEVMAVRQIDSLRLGRSRV
jgi:hypothetical protein